MSFFDPDLEYDPVVIRNNRLHVGCIFCQPADFSANLDSVIQPGAEWGRLSLQCTRQASILHRASSRDMNPFSFRHSCRSLPLNDSTVASSVGVPGREKFIRFPRSYPTCPAFSLQIQSRYQFSATEARDLRAQWCSASLRPPLSADFGPRSSPDIRVCRDQ